MAFILCVCVCVLLDIKKQLKQAEIGAKSALEKQKNWDEWDLHICIFFAWEQSQIQHKSGDKQTYWLEVSVNRVQAGVAEHPENRGGNPEKGRGTEKNSSKICTYNESHLNSD